MSEAVHSPDEIIITDRLHGRPSRLPDHVAESRALETLAKELAENPANLLQKLAETIVELGIGDSAGVSIEETADVRQFRWVALAGVWSQLRGSTIPFDASPCGIAVQRDQLLLIESPEKFFAGAKVEPLIHEGLLVPFHVEGRPVGTLWINVHSPHRRFDREDVRLLQVLARFASAAHQMVLALGSSEAGRLESASRLNALAHASSDVFYIMSADMRELRELSGGDFLADATSPSREWLRDYIPPEDHARTLAAINKAIETKGVFELEHRVRKLDGGVGWALSRAVPITGPDGEIAEWFGAASDITERKQAEAALRDSEQRFRALAVTGAFSVYRMSPDWRLMYELDGGTLATTDEPIDDWFDKYILEDDRPTVWRAIHRAIETRSLFELEHRVRLADGGVGWVLSRAVPILGPDGEIVEWFGAGSDVTERRRAQEKLRESEELRRIAVESGRMGTWRWDLRDELIWGDAAFLSLWGHAPSDEPYRLSEFTERMSPQGRAEMGEMVTRAIAAGEEFDSQLAVVSGPTKGHWVRWRGCAEREQPWIVNGVSFDVTEQRARDERLRESEERQAFLLDLGDAMRAAKDADAVVAVAARMLGQKLQASRIAFAEIDAAAGIANIRPGWSADGVPAHPVTLNLADFGGPLLDDLNAGRTVRYDDVGSPPFARPDLAALAAIGIKAGLSVPLLVGGRFVVNLNVHQNTPRIWTDAEVALTEDVAARVWEAVERARAEAALRASEEKYRTLFENMGQGYALGEVIRDEEGHAVDLRYLELNPAFERLSGIPVAQAQGRTVREVYGQVEPEWFEVAERVARLKIPERVEYEIGAIGRWYQMDFYPAEGDRYLGLYEEVTDRKRQEFNAALLAEIGDELSRLSTPDEIIEAVGARLGASLRLSGCIFADVDEANNEATIHHGWNTADVASLKQTFRLADYFGEEFRRAGRAGETVVVRDTTRDGRANAEAYARLKLGSFVTVPFLRQGRWVANITATTREPRDWRARDVALLQEVASRVFPRIERARAEAALRASEEAYRTLFETMSEGFSVCELLRDARGAPIDWRYLELNAAFERQTGLRRDDFLNRTATEIMPGFEPFWLRTFADVVDTQQPVQFEREFAPLGRWFHVSVYPRDGDRFAVLYHDVTERKRAETVLRESEERFRTLAESIEDVFYMTDLERGALEYLSPAYERIWGRPASELLADLSGFNAAIHADDLAQLEDGKAAQLRGEPVAVEYRIVRPHGDVRWIYDRCFPVGDGTRRRSAGVASDITERKRADAAAREVEERLRQFGEASSDVLWVRDAETLRWEYVSPAFEAIYGMSREQALAGDTMQNWADLIHPEDRDRAIENIKRVGQGERVTFEYRVRRPIDGEVRWLRNTDFPMRDGDGRVTRIGGVGQDVTELKAIEAAVADSEARLRTLMEGIPQLVWRSADNGQWTWSSPQWRSFTGQSEAESLGLGWLEAVHPDDQGAAMQAWEEAAPHGMLDVEYRVRRASDGNHLWHHTRSLPVRNGGGRIVEWLGTTTEVQQLKELQERQTVMVAELQHRTRNLIAVVRSIANQTMESTGPTEAFRDEFNDRLEALARVQGLLSRSEEEPITMQALIGMELDALGAGASAGRVSIEGPQVRIRSSVVQTLSLALHELATNARKYGALSNDTGSLRVTWRTYEDDRARRLALEWEEIGGNAPQQADGRRGYGRELIERALPYALSAKTAYEHDEAGLRCTIDMPLERKERRRRTP